MFHRRPVSPAHSPQSQISHIIVMLRITNRTHARSKLAELADRSFCMLRTGIVLFAHVIGGRFPSATGWTKQVWQLQIIIDARSSSHLLIDESLPNTSCRMVPQNQMGCPESRSSQVLMKTIRGDFDLTLSPPIGIPGGPLVPHLFPEPADGKAKRPLPGPTHIHVATLILDILAGMT